MGFFTMDMMREALAHLMFDMGISFHQHENVRTLARDLSAEQATQLIWYAMENAKERMERPKDEGCKDEVQW